MSQGSKDLTSMQLIKQFKFKIARKK